MIFAVCTDVMLMPHGITLSVALRLFIYLRGLCIGCCCFGSKFQSITFGARCFPVLHVHSGMREMKEVNVVMLLMHQKCRNSDFSFVELIAPKVGI